MFYFKTGLTRRIRVHPKYIGGKHDALQMARKMAKQSLLETPFSPEYGYIIRLVCISDVGDGYCLPQVGHIEFPITFEAIVLYPVVGEVVDAEVVKIIGTCIIFRYACVYGVVRDYSLNDRDYFQYEERPLITKGNKDGLVKEGLYRSQVDPSKTIEKETIVRVRILKRTLGGNGFFLVGSMFGEHLGPVANPVSPPPTPSPNPNLTLDKILTNLKVDDDVIPHHELQKLWLEQPYQLTPDEYISSDAVDADTSYIAPTTRDSDCMEVTSTSQ